MTCDQISAEWGAQRIKGLSVWSTVRELMRAFDVTPPATVLEVSDGLVYRDFSPHMVADPRTVWLGLEYFCNKTDELWTMPKEQMAELAKEELARIGIIDAGEVLDWTVLHVEKTYPAYFGTFDRFSEIRSYVDRYDNLFLLGRNGMHRYNNQDHSMLTAMVAVDNIVAGNTDNSGIWDVNTETDYHEEQGHLNDRLRLRVPTDTPATFRGARRVNASR